MRVVVHLELAMSTERITITTILEEGGRKYNFCSYFEVGEINVVDNWRENKDEGVEEF